LWQKQGSGCVVFGNNALPAPQRVCPSFATRLVLGKGTTKGTHTMLTPTALATLALVAVAFTVAYATFANHYPLLANTGLALIALGYMGGM